MSTKPAVHVLGTGGTIANITGQYQSRDDFVSVDDLLERAPEEVTSYAELSLTEITHLNSGALPPEVWFDLHAAIEQRAAEAPPSGFVVTHGSNTSEETAYFLHLALDTDLPVVVTAAQRNIGKLGSEGFKNLYDAVRVAADPDAGGRGVMLVANEEIHGARDVTKVVASRPDAWRSPNEGRLGDALHEINFHARPERPHTGETAFSLDGVSVDDFPLLDVQIVYSAFADDGTMVRAAVEAGAEGIVCAAFPTSSPAWPDGHPQQGEALLEAAEAGVPVVLCNRGLEGYKEVEDGFISGGTLRPQKARILLALGLMETRDHAELQRLFETY